ncbi:CPBP family intramembrane glutamic endopeptidase [Nocardia otitidiscaviarum]|uniref:CPBP family intramembrane glutamic endopeptidase n=1 Tax=Nocardia otitidiscaviarum TaxID=1823 RepID=UPI001E5D4C40|nr:CPBP family intramembrane glutamic endopeptidase [Nocardia otitidiscaviarum]
MPGSIDVTSCAADPPGRGVWPPWSRMFFQLLAAATLSFPLMYCSSAVLWGQTGLAVLMAVCFGYLGAALVGISAFLVRPRSTVQAEARTVVGLLGFRRPEPGRWSRRPLLVWCLVIPALLAAADLGLALGLGAVWHPDSDAAQAAARAERAELFTRNGTFGAAVLMPFLVAAVPEEIRYRALVLLTQRVASALAVPRLVRWLVVAAAGSASVVLFALAHAPFGPMNVVTSAIGGAIYTGLALYTRSLWPAIMCHGLYDAAAVTLTIL